MNLFYTSRAKEDIDLAFAWYERQRRGLGFDFLDCMESSVNLIIETPDLYKFIELGISFFIPFFRVNFFSPIK